jgi:hypothetical protein
MKKFILIFGLFFCINSYAVEVWEKFTDSSQLKPYIEWIAKNTRFTDAEQVVENELPKIYLMGTAEYDKNVPPYKVPWMDPKLIWPRPLAIYWIDKNEIYVNQDLAKGDPGVIMHEMIHFYQFRANRTMDKPQAETEAYALQKKFNQER